MGDPGENCKSACARHGLSDCDDPHYDTMTVGHVNSDCGVVIEEFDHVCPWTGTAIGKRNMGAFKTFNGCLVVNIVVLAAVAVFGLRTAMRSGSGFGADSSESQGADDTE